jgi:hypothetical protein
VGKKINAAEALSAISGLSQETVNEIWEKVKANSQALKNCPGPHNFQPFEKAVNPLDRKKWRCDICGGTLDGVTVLFYQQGLAHGRAKVNNDSR